MSKQVGYLAGREGSDAAVRLFYSVDQCGGEGVTEGVKALPLQPCCLQDSVMPFAEVHRTGVIALLIGDQGAVLSEVPFCSQVEDGVHSCLIQGYIPLAGGCFQPPELFFALLEVYLFFLLSAIKLHFFLGVFLHFIIGADSLLSAPVSQPPGLFLTWGFPLDTMNYTLVA